MGMSISELYMIAFSETWDIFWNQSDRFYRNNAQLRIIVFTYISYIMTISFCVPPSQVWLNIIDNSRD